MNGMRRKDDGDPVGQEEARSLAVTGEEGFLLNQQ